MDVHCFRRPSIRRTAGAHRRGGDQQTAEGSRIPGPLQGAGVFFKARAPILAFLPPPLDHRGFSPRLGRWLKDREGATVGTRTIPILFCDRVADPDEDARSFVASSKRPIHPTETLDVSVKATHKDEGEVGRDIHLDRMLHALVVYASRICGLVVLHVAAASRDRDTIDTTSHALPWHRMLAGTCRRSCGWMAAASAPRSTRSTCGTPQA